MTKHLDRAKLLGHLGPDEKYENYKMGIPAAVVTRQQLRNAIRAGKFDIEPEPIGNTEQFAEIRKALEELDIAYEVDAAEVTSIENMQEAIEMGKHLLAEVERLQTDKRKLLEGLNAIANTSGFKSDIYYTDGIMKYEYARKLLSLYGGKGDTDAALE